MENSLPKRSSIDSKYKWNLENIYENVGRWEEDYNNVKKLINEIKEYQGKLVMSGKDLTDCLLKNDELMSICDKVFVYSKMKRDEDNNNSMYQSLADRAMTLVTEAHAASSYIVPEIISIPEEKLKEFIRMNNSLKVYNQFFDELLRQKKHILSEKEEKILAMVHEISYASKNIFTMFNNADIKFPMIRNEEGNDVELTKGRYITFLESKDRRVRKEAFDALYATYSKSKNTLAAALISNIKSGRFYATVRNYASSREASLDSDNLDISIYDNLISTIHKNLHLLHRYLKLRKKALKLEELHMYDVYVPIVEENKKKVSYEDAINMVEKALEPLGEEYVRNYKKGYSEGWIDVYENEGKTSGAYSWGAYLTHPYVLLNYQGTVNDVFTLAHEMGHALHTFYTHENQPYIYSSYKIFVAEVASTVNETLLMKYLLSCTDDRKERAYLLNHYLEEFRGTVFRQVMFSEFEKIIHDKIGEGDALTTESISEIYFMLNKKYFGEEVYMDEQISLEWSRIPHFYNSFYVYKYATGFCAAQSLVNQILTEGQPAIERYLEFLKSGSKDYPLNLLKSAGVDLSTSKPIEDGLAMFEGILNELEELLV